MSKTGSSALPAARRLLRALTIAGIALSLGSCALLGAREAPRETYEITAPSSFPGLRSGTRAQLLVKEPNALKAIDSDRIILKTTPNVITYVAGAQWSDSVPRMVQAKLVEAFENTGATRATAKPGDGLVIDFQLISDLRRFEIAQGTAVIEMSIKLLSDKSGRVLETRIFTASANAGGDDADSYVDAFEAAFATLSRDIAGWVLSSV